MEMVKLWVCVLGLCAMGAPCHSAVRHGVEEVSLEAKKLRLMSVAMQEFIHEKLDARRYKASLLRLSDRSYAVVFSPGSEAKGSSRGAPDGPVFEVSMTADGVVTSKSYAR